MSGHCGDWLGWATSRAAPVDGLKYKALPSGMTNGTDTSAAARPIRSRACGTTASPGSPAATW